MLTAAKELQEEDIGSDQGANPISAALLALQEADNNTVGWRTARRQRYDKLQAMLEKAITDLQAAVRAKAKADSDEKEYYRRRVLMKEQLAKDKATTDEEIRRLNALLLQQDAAVLELQTELRNEISARAEAEEDRNKWMLQLDPLEERLGQLVTAVTTAEEQNKALRHDNDELSRDLTFHKAKLATGDELMREQLETIRKLREQVDALPTSSATPLLSPGPGRVPSRQPSDVLEDPNALPSAHPSPVGSEARNSGRSADPGREAEQSSVLPGGVDSGLPALNKLPPFTVADLEGDVDRMTPNQLADGLRVLSDRRKAEAQSRLAPPGWSVDPTSRPHTFIQVNSDTPAPSTPEEVIDFESASEEQHTQAPEASGKELWEGEIEIDDLPLSSEE